MCLLLSSRHVCHSICWPTRRHCRQHKRQCPLQWAVSEAAVLCLRAPPAAHTLLARLEKKPGTGKAVTILAHTLARALSYRLPRQTACALDPFLHRSGRGAGALQADLDSPGVPLPPNARSGVTHCVAARP